MVKKPDYKSRFILLSAAFAVVFLGSFTLGKYGVPFSHLIGIIADAITRAVTSIFGGGLGLAQFWDDAEAVVVLNIRLPRIIAGALVGAALSVAGAAYQGMFRNPMVSPDILGASSGAGFGAALGILLSLSYIGISISAFALGLAAVFLAYAISRVSHLDRTLAMVLAGIMIGSLFTSCTSFVKLIADTEQELPAITYWLMGSLASIKKADVVFLIVPVIIGIVPIIALRWKINLLTVSEEEAGSLGINTRRLRIVVIFCATLLTAGSVAVSGLIGWVGLVIPHFCRMLFGYDYKRIIPASALLGATFLILVDDVARNITATEVPLGILTAFIGAPLFVYLIVTGGAQREH